jgi:hypothetical protein
MRDVLTHPHCRREGVERWSQWRWSQFRKTILYKAETFDARAATRTAARTRPALQDEGADRPRLPSVGDAEPLLPNRMAPAASAHTCRWGFPRWPPPVSCTACTPQRARTRIFWASTRRTEVALRRSRLNPATLHHLPSCSRCRQCVCPPSRRHNRTRRILPPRHLPLPRRDTAVRFAPPPPRPPPRRKPEQPQPRARPFTRAPSKRAIAQARITRRQTTPSTGRPGVRTAARPPQTTSRRVPDSKNCETTLWNLAPEPARPGRGNSADKDPLATWRGGDAQPDRPPAGRKPQPAQSHAPAAGCSRPRRCQRGRRQSSTFSPTPVSGRLHGSNHSVLIL